MPVILSATPYLPLTGGTLSGNLTINGHIQAGQSAPSAQAGVSAGTSPPAPVVTAGANDIGGAITFGTGGSPSAGIMVSVSYSAAWSIPGGGVPHVVICPANAAAQQLGLYVAGLGPTGFNVSCTTAPAASQAASVYQFTYITMG